MHAFMLFFTTNVEFSPLSRKKYFSQQYAQALLLQNFRVSSLSPFILTTPFATCMQVRLLFAKHCFCFLSHPPLAHCSPIPDCYMFTYLLFMLDRDIICHNMPTPRMGGPLNINRNAHKIGDYFLYQTDTKNQGNPACCNTYANRVVMAL